MAEPCSNENCTVQETGICVLGNDPHKCEFRHSVETPANEASSNDDDEVKDSADPVLTAPDPDVPVDNGLALGLDELRGLMSAKDTFLIGVLGSPASGKTAALVSIYLQLATGKLSGFRFADSETLLSLDQISRGARSWAEAQPDELTARTELSDIRQAGFLHAMLLRESDQRLVDIAFSDLPGEWSDDLAETNRTDRFDFLKAADSIWILVNGEELRNLETRMRTVRRTKLLLQRLHSMDSMANLAIKVVVSHADQGPISEELRSGLLENSPFDDIEIAEVASFSRSDEVAPGAGLAQLLEASFPTTPPRPEFWGEGRIVGNRYALRYEAGGDFK